MSKILCCGLFPALQRTLALASLKTGAVNRVREVTLSAGGKAINTARVLKALGASPVLFGFSGGNAGMTIEHILEEEGLEITFISTDAPSRICSTILADDADDFTELVEEGPVLSAYDWARLQSCFMSAWRGEALEAGAGTNFDALVISGTLPGHAPTDVYAGLLQGVAGKPVILDTSGRPLLAALSQRPTLVKINSTELFKTVGFMGEQDPERIEAASQTLLKLGAGAVGITQGGAPAWLITRDRTLRFAMPSVKVESTLGCGDSVNAGVAFALQRGDSLENAFAFGLACGVSNAMNRFPGVVVPDQVVTFFSQMRASV